MRYILACITVVVFAGGVVGVVFDPARSAACSLVVVACWALQAKIAD